MIAMCEGAQSVVQVLNKELPVAHVLIEFSKQRWLSSQFKDQFTILVEEGGLINQIGLGMNPGIEIRYGPLHVSTKRQFVFSMVLVDFSSRDIMRCKNNV